MDRISAIRNVEEALAAFEAGECDLAGLERRVRGTLRTYATEFEGDLDAYRASGDDDVDGLVVLASSRREARERIRELATEGGDDGGDEGGDDLRFEVERVE
jgi:alkanesulfonate monooxygenase SsuD/methylene tetrahydromethanopterin reductase-like flavin-dependent oxidoreductase (luciferase family)